jgi:hypothetical protein
VGLREICPELKASHAFNFVSFRHFLMDDSTPRGHPLHVSGRDSSTVAHAVAMLDDPLENVSDGLDSAVRFRSVSVKEPHFAFQPVVRPSLRTL